MGDTIKTAADRRDGRNNDIHEFQKLSNTEQSSFDKGSDYGSQLRLVSQNEETPPNDKGLSSFRNNTPKSLESTLAKHKSRRAKLAPVAIAKIKTSRIKMNSVLDEASAKQQSQNTMEGSQYDPAEALKVDVGGDSYHDGTTA